MRGFSKSQNSFPSNQSRGSVRISSWPSTFRFFHHNLPASLSSSVNCSLYADDLAIWFSSPSVPIVVEATEGSLIRLERWSKYWCLPLNPSKYEAFFLVDPHQANLQPHLFINSHRFNPTPAFLGVTFDCALSFSKHASSLKAKFFPRFKAVRCILLPQGVPVRSPLLLCIKLFVGPFSLTLHPDGFLS